MAFAKKARGEASDDEGDTKEAGAPKPGDGPKSATANAAPGERDHEAAPAPLPASEGAGDGAPKPGDGPKSATSNAEPTGPAEPAAAAASAPAAPAPAAAAGRAKSETIAMAPGAATGAPPALPMPLGAVEDPTQMPPGNAVEAGDPDAPAPPPGDVPRGDSRSLRRPGEREEFVLIYRRATQVITRSGIVGTRGQWKVVDYPTPASAANAYARECSRFVSEGFSDYRS